MDTRETPRSMPPTRALPPPWRLQVTTSGDAIELRTISESTIVLEVTAHYDKRDHHAAVPLSSDSARALRDQLTRNLGE